MGHEQDQRFGRERFQVRVEREHGEHAIGDACPAVVGKGLKDIAQEIYTGVAFTVRFYPEIRELNRLVKSLRVDADPLADFSEGAVFDPNAYPTGTLLRTSTQIDWLITKFAEEIPDDYKNQLVYPPVKEEEYRDIPRDKVSYGIVARNGKSGQKCVVGSPGIFDQFDPIIMDRIGPVQPYLLTAPYQVGAWRHRVEIITIEEEHHTGEMFSPLYQRENFRGYRTEQDDIFYRLNKIEVMMMGKGDKEKKSEPIPLFHRVKNVMRTAD